MNIAFLNIYKGVIERGSEIYVEELANGLSKKYDVTVFQAGKNDKNKKSLFKTKVIQGIPFFSYQSSGLQRFRLINILFQEIYHLIVLLFTILCAEEIIRENFDLVIPVNGRWQVLIIRFLRFFKGFKILITGHAGIGFEERFNILAGKPDFFVALSKKALEWAKRINPSIRTEFIPNGVNTDIFKKKESDLNINLKNKIILCVSALLPYKRINLLIEAVSKIPDLSLLVIGDGILRSDMESRGKNLLSERFRLIPYVPHRLLPRYYSAASVFSLPSRESEAFGLVYLEALACNLPVVAPDDPNRREIIANAGLYVDPENTINYSRVLLQALATDFKDLPRKQAEKFSWDNIIGQYLSLFESGYRVLNHK